LMLVCKKYSISYLHAFLNLITYNMYVFELQGKLMNKQVNFILNNVQCFQVLLQFQFLFNYFALDKMKKHLQKQSQVLSLNFPQFDLQLFYDVLFSLKKKSI
jgi:hypothetical protein